MKRFTHAWLALKAVEHLEDRRGTFGGEREEHLDGLLSLLNRFPNTFVRGAWFPDSPIADNTEGGHTWKYSLDDAHEKRPVRYRPPGHNHCLEVVQGRLRRHVWLNVRRSKLADRCEALGYTVRDATLVTNKLKKGDVLAFNDSQIALLFLMLSHYICDAHVPVHCDDRDLNDPSKVHGDLEGFWERQVKRYFSLSKGKKNFDLDEENRLQRKPGVAGYDDSILKACEDLAEDTDWATRTDRDYEHWSCFLGNTNSNLWDYAVSVCLVSFHMSLELFPDPPPPDVDYDDVAIKDVPAIWDRVVEHSPKILADAIVSTAVVWLAAWERWHLLR